MAVTLEPSIARLIEIARAEAAAKARKAKAALAKRLARKKDGTVRTAAGDRKKPTPGKPLKIATN